MLILPANRAVSVLQDAMLKEVVVEKEMYEGTKKAKAAIDRMMAGLPMEQELGAYGALEPPLDEVEDEEAAVRDPMTRRNLGVLQPETVPSDDEFNPFPGLERPLG